VPEESARSAYGASPGRDSSNAVTKVSGCRRIHFVSTERTDLATALGKDSAPVEPLSSRVANSCRSHRTQAIQAGELLFSEGEPCNGLHIIARGKVRIFKTSVNGREQVLAVNVPGESVAELPVFDGGPFPASASAVEETEIVIHFKARLPGVLHGAPQVALKVLKVVGARLRRLVGIIEELSFTTIRQRLISVLIKLAQSEGKKTEHGIAFQLPATHQELANQLGTVRELISRNLMRLQAEGLLDVDARQIVVKDMKGLSALLDANS
jgi:CRP/FNR family transcriptional regulator, cyclic AMP receptor protein